MTSWLNARIEALKPSATLSLKSTVSELRRSGREIVDMSTGEPDMDTPEHIKAAAIEALRQGKTKYTDVVGILELREAIAKKLREENGIRDAQADTVVVTNGGKQAIMQFFQAVLSEGDEVIIPAPYWVSYPAMAEICGARAVIAKTKSESNYCIDPETLLSCISPKSRILVLNSPSNPSGAGYRLEDYRKIEEIIAKHPKLLVLSDEVYEKIVFSGFTFISAFEALPSVSDRVVTVNALSKSYSMTGWRVGYIHAPKSITSGIGRLQSQMTSNVCSIAQHAALAAIQGDQSFLKDWCGIFRQRIELGSKIVNTCEGLSLPKMPDGAFYLFIRAEELLQGKGKKFDGSLALAKYFLESAGVAVVPGVEFGDDDAFRVSVACSDEVVKDGLTRIVESIAAVS